ncbi:MAG: TonB-dependent receptor [Chitinophagaceae bacterium]|nr:TonB-dependent receptor [Chitinophagaceae bacterium]
MRLIVFFMIVGCLQAGARGYGQNINLSAQNASLESVLKKIKKQAGYHLVYREEWLDLANKVSLNLKNVPVTDALNACFKNQSLTYELVGKTIVVKKVIAPEPETPKPVAQQPQDIVVTGKILDQSGNPLENVSIVVKGTGKGVSTAADGSFSISVPDERSVLVISYVGMETQEVTVGKNKTLDIALTPIAGSMEDVVVVAYGKQKKLTVTGAVSTVGTAELKQSSSASLANALAGRLPGLTSIQSGGGQPGRDDATMYLRGAATTNGRAPLILIDGVPRDNIRTIDPNEVASVSILKDASATAVFGVRGANGVILITTKRGSKGKTQLTASVDQSFSSFTREPERLESLDYMRLRNEAAKNDGITDPPFSQEVIARYTNPLEGLDPNAPDYEEQVKLRNYMYPNHDYYREYIAKYVPQTRVNLGASGGTDRLSYFVNGVYLHQGGNLKTEPKSVLGYDPSSWMDRYNFRANLDYKISSSLKALLNIGSYIEQVNMPAAWLYGDDTNWMMRDLIYQAQTILPITPGPTTLPGFGVPAGQIVDPGYMDRSAFEIMNRFGYRKEVRSNLNTSLGLEWDLGKIITQGLSIKGLASYDARATTAMQGDKSERLYLAEINPATNTLSYAIKRPSESPISLRKGADSRYNINLQGSLNYQRGFGLHDVGGMVLFQRDYWESTAGEIPFNVIGLAGRATYAFDNRYLAEINIGYNGSEQFAPSRRFGFFPAASIGWVISNEKFMQPLAATINNLKIRASYGKVGNDRIGSARFLYQDNITVGGGPLGSLAQGQGINQGLLGNRSISWEVAEKKNLGIDIGLFNDLSLSFDYFTEHRTDILISRGTVPEFQGVPLGNIPKANMGIVNNRGFEVEARYQKTLSQNFSITASGNIGFNKNKVAFLDEAQRDETYAHRYRSTGYSMNQAWGLNVDYSNGNGYFNSQEELDGYLTKTTYSFGSPRVGDLKYVDLNGDGVIDDKDEAPIGYTSIPGINYGFTVGFQYKGFELSVFVQGVGRYSSNYGAQGVYENIIRGTYFGYHKTAWTAERYAAGEEITYPALSTRTTTNHRANDFFIMNRSYVRLRNLELAYNLPGSILSTLGLQGVRFYVSGQNVALWEKLRMDHLDPENNDPIGYPVTKQANFGVSITF